MSSSKRTDSHSSQEKGDWLRREFNPRSLRVPEDERRCLSPFSWLPAYTLLAAAVLFLIASPAMAGMGSPLPFDVAKALHLTEPAEMRLEAISFFVAVLLISPLAVRWLWNAVARDFPHMPRISYGRSLALVAIWGLLFLVVLTMIAATRELMTPGAWQKQGLLYKLPASQAPAKTEPKQLQEKTP